jgi:hypothetical protein
VGTYALYNDTGIDNTAVGYQSLYYTSTGASNTAVGMVALCLNSTGTNNTAVGSQALQRNSFGNNNTAVGICALTTNTTGSNNVAIGDYALYSNVTGSGNVAIGNYAGYSSTTSNNFFISNGVIGSATTPLIQGSFDPAGGSNGSVKINGNLTVTGLGTAASLKSTSGLIQISDARLKDINGDYKYGLDKINKLKVKKYKFKKNNPLNISSKEEHIGVIAQDLQKVMPEAVIKDSEDGYLLVSRNHIDWAMVNAVKELSKENDDLKIKNTQVEEKISNLEERMERVKKIKHIETHPKGFWNWLKDLFRRIALSSLRSDNHSTWIASAKASQRRIPVIASEQSERGKPKSDNHSTWIASAEASQRRIFK